MFTTFYKYNYSTEDLHMKESMNYNRREVVAQQKGTRIAELKKRIILSCSFIALLAVAVVTAISFVNVNATVQGDNPSYKYYTSYEVQPGDTLTSIAQKYTANSNVSVPEYISEVKKNNELSSDNITAGNYIVISYYSNEYK